MKFSKSKNIMDEQLFINKIDLYEGFTATAGDMDTPEIDNDNDIIKALNKLYKQASACKETFQNEIKNAVDEHGKPLNLEKAWKIYQERIKVYPERYNDYIRNLDVFKDKHPEEYRALVIAENEDDEETIDKINAWITENAPVKPKKREDPIELAQQQGYVNEERILKNLLFEGEYGAGKSSIVEAWCKAHNLIAVSVKSTDLNRDDFQITIYNKISDRVEKKGTNEYDRLDDPFNPGILIIDELNRSSTDVQNSILQLIANHEIYTSTGNKKHILKGLLFSVGIQNPYDVFLYPGTKELDHALASRFQKLPVTANPKSTLIYLRNKLKPNKNASIEAQADDLNKLAIAEKILNNEKFEFTTRATVDAYRKNKSLYDAWNKIMTNPRGFAFTLLSCDGTKEDFLHDWNSMNDNQQYKFIETILSDFKDIEDRKNEILKYWDEKNGTKTTTQSKTSSDTANNENDNDEDEDDDNQVIQDQQQSEGSYFDKLSGATFDED